MGKGIAFVFPGFGFMGNGNVKDRRSGKKSLYWSRTHGGFGKRDKMREDHSKGIFCFFFYNFLSQLILKRLFTTLKRD